MTALTLLGQSTLGTYLWVPIMSFFSYLHLSLIVQPLETIYLFGPRVLGCWEGQALEDICVSLAPRTKAAFWQDHPQECMALIDKNIYSWILVVQYTLAIAGSWILLKTLYGWWWRRRLMGDLETLLHQMTLLSRAPHPPPLKTLVS